MKKKLHDDSPGKAIPGAVKILLKMKLTLCVILFSFLGAMASESYSQTTKLSLDLKHAKVRDVLGAIENQSEFFFLYSEKLIDVTREVNIEVLGSPIEKILDKIFEGTNVNYTVKGRQIVLSTPEANNNVGTFSVSQQQKPVSGKVTDSSGASLPGVSVVIKGTTTGAITDVNGNYSIANIQGNEILQFSFVGMKSQEIAIGGKTTINVMLAEESIGIEEVVAVGYGTQKKVNLTGAIGAISGDLLVSSPSTNVISSLQGRLPGVSITQGSGAPGKENVSILIRGLGTMNDASPMVVVDGLESRMDNISSNDIESISILKDASSAAIYGTRAANGVILVTTKRGKSGRSEITYNSSYMWQKATRLAKHLSSAQYAELYNEGNRNEGLAERYSAEDISKYRSGVDPYNFPNTDWLGLLITESGFTQNHNLSFSGGNDKTSFRTSFEYFDQGGLIKQSGHKRYNARVNLDSKIREWFTTGLNIGLSRNNVTNGVFPQGDGGENQYFRQTNYIPPTISNKNADGTWNRYTDGNPIAWAEDGGINNSNNSHLLGSVFGEVKLIKGLTLKGIAGVDYNLDDNKAHQKTIEYGNGTVQGPNYVRDYLARQLTVSLQSFLNYDITVNKHGFKALLGVSRESFSVQVNDAYRQDFPSNELDQLNAGSTTGWTNSGYANESKLGSFFGRINYDYDNKYLFETNLRRDASSKFSPDNRVGWFPSMSAGWRMTEEDFMQSISLIDNLKLRASWGQLGNHRIDDYIYLQRITLGQKYDFGGNVVDGAATIFASNKDISWEKTSELDLGIDIDLFHNKLLSISADYYNRYTDNILTPVPVSIVFGLEPPVVNAGAMRNKGLELLLEHKNKIGDWQYSIAFNTAFNKNWVVKFPNPSKGDRILAEGVSWNSFYGYKATGIYQTDTEAEASPHITGITVKAGDLIYQDQNGDGKIDGDDRVVLGNSIPEITFGSNLNVMYKGFELSAFFQGAGKVYRTLGGETFWPFDPENALSIHLDRTIVENGQVVTPGHYPRTVIQEIGNRVQSSFTVLDASYLRLKNLQLGYNLPASWLKVVKIAKARAYISGQNLLTITNFPESFDPEIGGDASYSYPQVKFYTIGFDVTF